MPVNVPQVICFDADGHVAATITSAFGGGVACVHGTTTAAVLAACERDPGQALLVAAWEVVRPGDGLELMAQLHDRWPDLPGILMAPAAHLADIVGSPLARHVWRFVRLPHTRDELLRAIEDALAYRRLQDSERRLREQLAATNAELDQKVEDLDEANELLEYWVEFSPAVLYSLTCDEGRPRPSYIGKNFHRLTGFERTAAVVDADFWSALVHPDDRARYLGTLASLVEGDDSFAVLEYRIRHRAGTWLTVVDSLRAVRDGEGDTIELVGAWMDVSARR